MVHEPQAICCVVGSSVIHPDVVIVAMSAPVSFSGTSFTISSCTSLFLVAGEEGELKGEGCVEAAYQYDPLSKLGHVKVSNRGKSLT